MDNHQNSSLYGYNLTVLHQLAFSCHVDLDNESRRMSLFLLYLVLFMVGLTLNCVVVWVNWQRRNSRNGVLFCALNIGISDLMMMIVLPFFMLEAMMDHVWVWGDFMCRFTNVIFITTLYSSSFFLAYMTVERYLTVVQKEPRPWGPKERRRRAVLCGLLWVVSIVLSLLENAHVRLVEWDEPGCYIFPEYNFVHWFVALTLLCLIFQFFGPGIIIVTFNLRTYKAVQAFPETQGNGRHLELWLVHLYSLVFVLCWLPFHIVMLLLLVDDIHPWMMSCRMVEHIYFSFSIVQCLSLIHCVANPILYNFLSRSFRGNLIADIACHLPKAAIAGAEAENHGNSLEGGRKGIKRSSKKTQEVSDGSTSQSDVDS